ncbi:MAG TPA: carboxypeptidase-like regulatory domain-containing protein [Nitrososphaeraceae archaeon]|nr:carboxypeptidase-like regulatory domain-containing protein [Nitrososphaeraceae archaeon]
MGAGTSRRIGYFTAASFLIFLLVVSLVVPVNITFSSQTAEEEQFPRSIIAASSTDTTPHSLELRAIQDGDNAEPKKVSGFKLDMTNVVGAQINSQVLVFVTDSSVKVSEAKVRTVSDRLIDLVPSSQANTFSLTNLPVGVYTLDIITQKGNAKAAYEGILVISQQPTTVISETTRNVINQEINQNTRVVIDDDDDGDNGRDCDPSYPDVCIRPYPPDLDCGDIQYTNFRVLPPDPHDLDREGDGIGCETNGSNGGNNGDGSEDEDGSGECIEDNGYSLSEGFYVDDEGHIVGSPCDPVEFCEDKNSDDPTVIDFCKAIWTDQDEDICPANHELVGWNDDNEPICRDLLDDDDDDECPQGFVGKPPFCELVDCNKNPDAEGCEGLPSPPPDPCDTDNPPDYCEDVCIDPSCAITECPDGRIVPPGQSCDEDNDEGEDEGEVTPPEEISEGDNGDEGDTCGGGAGGDDNGGRDEGGEDVEEEDVEDEGGSLRVGGETN